MVVLNGLKVEKLVSYEFIESTGNLRGSHFVKFKNPCRYFAMLMAVQTWEYLLAIKDWNNWCWRNNWSIWINWWSQKFYREMWALLYDLVLESCCVIFWSIVTWSIRFYKSQMSLTSSCPNYAASHHFLSYIANPCPLHIIMNVYIKIENGMF